MCKLPSKEFFKGGIALVTLENPRGDKFEYRFRAELLSDGAVLIFVDYFDDGDWRYMGRYKQGGKKRGEFVVETRRSGYAANSQAMQVIDWFCFHAAWGIELPEGYTWHSDGRCPRCRVLLRNHKSVVDGVGKHCKAIIASDELLKRA